MGVYRLELYLTMDVYRLESHSYHGHSLGTCTDYSHIPTIALESVTSRPWTQLLGRFRHVYLFVGLTGEQLEAKDEGIQSAHGHRRCCAGQIPSQMRAYSLFMAQLSRSNIFVSSKMWWSNTLSAFKNQATGLSTTTPALAQPQVWCRGERGKKL